MPTRHAAFEHKLAGLTSPLCVLTSPRVANRGLECGRSNSCRGTYVLTYPAVLCPTRPARYDADMLLYGSCEVLQEVLHTRSSGARFSGMSCWVRVGQLGSPAPTAGPCFVHTRVCPRTAPLGVDAHKCTRLCCKREQAEQQPVRSASTC